MNVAAPSLYGAVEGGGTRFVCAVGTSPSDIIDSTSVPTTDPAATMAGCLAFFRQAQDRHGALRALGIGCFGPLGLRRGSPDFGHVLETPKRGWSGAAIVDPLSRADSGYRWRSTPTWARPRWANGASAPGAGWARWPTLRWEPASARRWRQRMRASARLLHPEMGHVPVRRDRRVRFAGVCPFHGDCVEGLASGPAVHARWGCDLEALPAAHEGRSIIAGYLGSFQVPSL